MENLFLILVFNVKVKIVCVFSVERSDGYGSEVSGAVVQ